MMLRMVDGKIHHLAQGELAQQRVRNDELVELWLGKAIEPTHQQRHLR